MGGHRRTALTAPCLRRRARSRRTGAVVPPRARRRLARPPRLCGGGSRPWLCAAQPAVYVLSACGRWCLAAPLPAASRSWSSRRGRRGLIWRVGRVGRGVWRRLGLRRRVVTVKSGARLADVTGCDNGVGRDRRLCRAMAREHVCVQLTRGAAARNARWRHGGLVGHVCRRIWRRLGRRRRVLTAKNGARLALRGVTGGACPLRVAVSTGASRSTTSAATPRRQRSASSRSPRSARCASTRGCARALLGLPFRPPAPARPHSPFLGPVVGSALCRPQRGFGSAAGREAPFFPSGRGVNLTPRLPGREGLSHSRPQTPSRVQQLQTPLYSAAILDGLGAGEERVFPVADLWVRVGHQAFAC